MKDYDALFSTTLSTAAKLIAPDSLANDSVRELEFVSEKDRQIAQDAADLVQPGDIIFVTTPGRFYAFWRRITNNLHDHAVVVIDKETVLHVGPPRARKLQLQRLLLPKRQPAILRPNLTPEQRECFVDSMKQLEHCTYDIIRAYRLIVRLALDHLYSIKPLRPLKPCDWKYRSWICSDAILYLLADSNPEMMKMIKESASKLDLVKHGSASFSDFETLRFLHPTQWTRIPLPAVSYTTAPAQTSFWSIVRSIPRILPGRPVPIQVVLYVIVLLALVKRASVVRRICIHTAQLVLLKKVGMVLLNHLDQAAPLSKL